MIATARSFRLRFARPAAHLLNLLSKGSPALGVHRIETAAAILEEGGMCAPAALTACRIAVEISTSWTIMALLGSNQSDIAGRVGTVASVGMERLVGMNNNCEPKQSKPKEKKVYINSYMNFYRRNVGAIFSFWSHFAPGLTAPRPSFCPFRLGWRAWLARANL